MGYRYPARVLYSSVFFVLIMCLVFVSKPRLLFEKDGEVRAFGVGEGRTMLSLAVVTVVAAVLSMFTFSLIDLVYG